MTFAEYLLHILGEDHLALYEKLGELVVALLVFREDSLGPVILFGYHSDCLVVDSLSRGLGVWLLEVIFVVVVIADVRQVGAHSGIGNHAVDALGDTLQVVDGAGGDVSGEELLCRTSAEQRTDFVEHCLLGGDLSFLRHIPCSAESSASWHDGYLDQRVGMFGEP